MLSKGDFFKILVVTEQMQRDLSQINRVTHKLFEAANTNKLSKSNAALALAEMQISEAQRSQQKYEHFEKQFNVLYLMLTEFVDANFDWCQENLNQEQQEFVEMA
jgi:hypothetical protein